MLMTVKRSALDASLYRRVIVGVALLAGVLALGTAGYMLI